MSVIELSRQLVSCADLGELLCEDKHCSVFYKIVRDCAVKILDQAEKERGMHMDRGVWEKVDAGVSETTEAKDK